MSHNENDLPGVYRRPAPGEHRAPCPALNALANCGHVPREGRVTAAQLVSAMEKHLGIAPKVGAGLANAALDRLGTPGPDGVKVLSLADLALHGFIEHDASLTRRDAHRGDASELLQPLVEQLVSLSRDGRTLTLEDLAVAHQLRMAQCKSDGHAVPIKAAVLGTLEAALLYTVLSRDGAIAIPDLIDFLQHERVPAGLPRRKVGLGLVLAAAAAISALGNVPMFNAAKRARKAAHEIPEPGGARCPVAHA